MNNSALQHAPIDHLLLIVVTATALAIFLNVILRKAQLPAAMGYIIAGVIITSLFQLQSVNRQLLREVAEFGIVFMLFTIGLEFSIQNLRKMYREVWIHGTLQFLITGSVFLAALYFIFDFSMKGAILIGAALALSSTAIVLKFFDDRRETGRTYAKESIGILIFQDMAVIPILILIGIFTEEKQSIAEIIMQTAIGALIVAASLFLIGRFLLNRFFGWILNTHSHELFIAGVLLVVISSATLAHSFGFSYSLGAFIAGMMLAETHYKYQIEADLTPFRDVLLGVFFVSVGMQINIDFLLKHFPEVIATVTAVMLIKALIIYAILKFKHWHKVSLRAAISLAQVGEFSFVIVELTGAGGLIDHNTSQLLIIATTISIILTPFILTWQNQIVNLLSRVRKEEEPPETEQKTEKLSDHIIVIGYGFHGRRVVQQLKTKFIPYIIIDFQKDQIERARQSGDPTIFGNAAQKSILKKAGITRALGVIIAMDDEKRAALIAERITGIKSAVHIVIKASDKKRFEFLNNRPGTSVVDEHEEIAKTLVHYATSCELNSENQTR